MGAASRDLPGVAAQPGNLARQVRGGAAGLREDGAAIAEFEPIRVLVKSADEIEPVRALIRTAVSRAELMNRVELIVEPTNDSWIRDHGPIFINQISGNDGPKQIALDWIF